MHAATKKMVAACVLLVVMLAHFVCAADAKSKSVCYGKYGCFSNEPPFDRFMVLLPEPPNVVGTIFRLFTRENKLTSQILSDSDLDRLSNSNYDVRRRTIVVIHGYLEHDRIPWMNRMRYALLDRDDVNVITVGWEHGARLGYDQAVGNTRLVGAQVAELLKFLIANTNSTADDMYIVGFSLGSHIAGYAGKRLNKLNQPLWRITALDPAGSFFENRPKDARLDSGDAQFVDAIHTDADFAGLWQPLGHLDFYPNGGATQPKGCKDFIGGLPAQYFICDHMRCPEYFTETISGKCTMHGYYCKSQSDLQSGRCVPGSSEEVPVMGYDADRHRNDKRLFFKKYYMMTNTAPSFCAFHYMITLRTGTSWFAGTSAQVIVKIYGKDGDTGDMYLQQRRLNAGSVDTFVALSRKDVGELVKIDVRFNGIPIIEKWHLVSAIVKAGWKDHLYTACFNARLQTHGAVRRLRKGLVDC